MKELMFLLLSMVSYLNLIGQVDSISVKFGNKEIFLKQGDKIELGMGTNPYGSFKYVSDVGSWDVPLSIDATGKTFEIKKILTFKKNNEYWVRLKYTYMGALFKVLIDNGRCMAIDVGEIIKINGVEISKE